MRNELGAVAFRGQPEAALAIQRDTFNVEFLGSDTVTLDAQHAGDGGGLLRRVDGVDRRLVAIDRVGNGIKNARLFGIADQARKSAPADRCAVNGGGNQLRIGCFALSALIEHDVRADAAVLDQIDLVGRGEQIARRDGDCAFRRNARRQELGQFRLLAGVLVDSDDGGTLGKHEEVLLVAECCRFQTFRLDALGLGALFRIVADGRNRMLERGAGFIEKLARLVEDGKAARTALPVAFVGDDDAVVVQPLHRVRLALAAFLLVGELQLAIGLRVDAFEINRAGGEMRLHRAGLAVENDDMVVFLQRERDLAIGVDRNEFRLRIFRGDFGETGEFDLLQRRAVGNAVLQADRYQIASRHLRQRTFIHLFVALVFDCDGGKGLVRRDGNRIGLAAQITACLDLLGGDIDRHQLAGRVGAVFRRVDAGQNLDAGDGNRGRLAFEQQRAACLRGLRIGDVDEADATKRAVRIDQGLAIFAGGDDFSRRDGLCILVGRQVLRHRERRDAVENRLGSGRKSCGCEQRSSQSHMRKSERHYNPPWVQKYPMASASKT
ncbi:hypothetical protein D3C80_930530 [compost metagenome]